MEWKWKIAIDYFLFEKTQHNKPTNQKKTLLYNNLQFLA